MSDRTIKPVYNNYDKHNTYRYLMGRYNKEVNEKFYFETMIIEYALLEDRLKSFLYYLGTLNNRNSYRTIDNKKSKEEIKQIVCLYKEKDENDKLGITNISGKIKIIKAILRWVNECEEFDKNNQYLVLLKQECESLDIGGLFEILSKTQQWCAYRNEIVHALMNKNLDSLYEKIDEKSIEAYEYVKFISLQITILKKYNKIRKKLNMSLN